MFPSFELVRRVFLSAILTVFLRGTMAQVAVGLFGSILSQRIYSSYQVSARTIAVAEAKTCIYRSLISKLPTLW